MSLVLAAGLPALPPAADPAFIAVFGAFVVAFLVLAVVTLRWAIRRDRAGRAEWIARRGGGTPANRPRGGRGPAAPARRGGPRRR